MQFAGFTLESSFLHTPSPSIAFPQRTPHFSSNGMTSRMPMLVSNPSLNCHKCKWSFRNRKIFPWKKNEAVDVRCVSSPDVSSGRCSQTYSRGSCGANLSYPLNSPVRENQEYSLLRYWFSNIQKKPYSAITVQVERLTSEQYDEDDLSGIPDLIEVIRLQGTGPTEAARAIRKKL